MELQIPYAFAQVLIADKKYIKSEENGNVTYKPKYAKALNIIRSTFRNAWNVKPDDIKEVPAFKLTKDLTEHLLKLAKEQPDFKPSNYLIQQLNRWHEVEKNPTGGKPKTAKELKSAIESYVNQSKNRLVFKRDMDNNMLPYLVDDVTYRKSHQEDGERIYASCTIHLKYVEYNKIKSLTYTWYNNELSKSSKSVADMLAYHGFYLETPTMLQDYQSSTQKFDELRAAVGKQCYAIGHGKKYEVNRNQDRWWWYSREGWLAMMIEGHKSVVIIDNPAAEQTVVEERYDSSNYHRRKWYDKDGGDPDADESASADFEELTIPDHPYVICFHKEKHSHVAIHVNNLELYKYDPSLKDKLILPQDDLDLVDILVGSEGAILEDIISGKTGGVIIFGTGEPGLGKTLTAEVYSEVVGKPLYSVQSSQLGININELENNLIKILARAARWKAILLIDECDVYVKKRGDSIEQNAFVGTFLRVLEYYKGILFMTTNREMDIDDAILSRGTAHIKYQYPEPKNLSKLWKVMSDQYGAKMDDKLIDDLCKEFVKISGRDIKNITKLATIIAKNKNAMIDLNMIKHIAKFKDIKLLNQK
jgi:hypothetical protein